MQLPPPPVNKFPQYVSHIVRRLKTLSPAMGKVKIAQTLARAGLHFGATTVGRMLKGGEDGQDAGTTPVGPSCREGLSETPSCREGLNETPTVEATAAGDAAKPRLVTAKYPNHLWHADLTLVPTALGFWTSWMPFSLAQSWPFCWWVAVVVDHFSRRVMGFAAFKSQPTSEAVRRFWAAPSARRRRAEAPGGR